MRSCAACSTASGWRRATRRSPAARRHRRRRGRAFKRDVRSAPSRPTPSGSPAPTARCGASSATPSPTTCCAPSSTLVMLFSSAAEPAGQPTAADQPLVAAYRIAAATARRQRLDDAIRAARPAAQRAAVPLELPAVEGPRFLFYGAAQPGDAPKLLPDHGDPSLLALSGDALSCDSASSSFPSSRRRKRRVEPPQRAAAAARRTEEEEEEAKEKAKEAPAPTPAEAGGEERAFGKPPSSSPPPKAAPPRAKPKKKTADERAARKR